jgi:hypothetical protein
MLMLRSCMVDLPQGAIILGTDLLLAEDAVLQTVKQSTESSWMNAVPMEH